MLHERTGRPTLGVLPWRRRLWLDVEDSLALEVPREGGEPPLGPDGLDVAVVRLRWMSNFTDLDALAAEPGVAVRFTRSPADVARADLVVLPGTRATVEDLARLRADGLDVALAERARRAAPILGVCGGYQMLGERIEDEVESRRGEVRGLGLLPGRRPRFAPREDPAPPRRPRARLDGAQASAATRSATAAVRRHGAAPLIETAEGDEGCREGAVLGTSWHGLLEGDRLRRALLAWVADLTGRRWVPGETPFARVRERRLDDTRRSHRRPRRRRRAGGADRGRSARRPAGAGDAQRRVGGGHVRSAAATRDLAATLDLLEWVGPRYTAELGPPDPRRAPLFTRLSALVEEPGLLERLLERVGARWSTPTATVRAAFLFGPLSGRLTRIASGCLMLGAPVPRMRAEDVVVRLGETGRVQELRLVGPPAGPAGGGPARIRDELLGAHLAPLIHRLHALGGRVRRRSGGWWPTAWPTPA